MKKITTAFFVWLMLVCLAQVRSAGMIPKNSSVTVTVDHALSRVLVVEVNPISLKPRPAIPDQRKIMLDREHTGRVNLLLEGPAQIKIMNVWNDSSIYYILMPGTDFNIHLDTHRRNYRETGKVGEKENRFHDFITSETKTRLKRIAWNDPVGFIAQWKQLTDTLFQLIDSAAVSGLDTAYTAWDRRNVRSLLQAALRQQLVSYVTVRSLWPVNIKEYQEMAAGFTETQLNDPGFFTAEGDKDLVSAYYLFHAVMQYYKEDSGLLPSLEAVYIRALKEAVRVRSADIRNLMLDHLIVDAVGKTNDQGVLASLPPAFLKTQKEKYLRDLIHAKLQLLKVAGAGRPAPLFTAMDPDARPFSYNDYTGAFLYIDIWATWCHPCVAEFPYLERLKEKYADKPITFISVSIDRETDLWSRFLKDRKLVSGHFHSNPATRNNIRDVYLAKLIPAFILIDPQGKVISPSCYRPSDPAVGMLLDRLLP